MEARRLFDGFEQGLDRAWTGFEQGLFNGCSMVVQWLSPFVVVVGVGGEHECDSFSSETRKRFCME